MSASARGSAEEKCDMTHMVDRLRVEVAIFAHRKDLADLHVSETAPLLRERGQQRGWLADTGRDNDEVAVFYLINRIFGGAAFFLVQSLN